jgi:hypothetical protein
MAFKEKESIFANIMRKMTENPFYLKVKIFFIGL